MQYFAKLVSINDGNEIAVQNEDRLLVETYPRAEKIIAAFLSAGWQLKDRTQRVTPAVNKEGSYSFYLGGWDFLFVKEARDGEVDDGDRILQKALQNIASVSDGMTISLDDDDDDDGDDDDSSGDATPVEAEEIPDELRELADELGIDLATLLDSAGDDSSSGDSASGSGSGSGGDSDDGDAPDDDLIAQMNALLGI